MVFCVTCVKFIKQLYMFFPPFRPTLSAIETPKYEIEKFLISILNCLAINEFPIKDSFLLAKEIV